MKILDLNIIIPITLIGLISEILLIIACRDYACKDYGLCLQN